MWGSLARVCGLVTAHRPLSRGEITERLKRLAAGPAPHGLRTEGAMCYYPAPAPARLEHVCPACGERTLYATQWVSHSAVPDFSRLVSRLKGLDASIDMRGWCRHCTPDAKEPWVALIVHHEDGTETRTQSVTQADLRLLEEFLSGGDRHLGEYGVETPLRTHLPRLRAMLGQGDGAPGARGARRRHSMLDPGLITYTCPVCARHTLLPAYFADLVEEAPALLRSGEELPRELCRHCEDERRGADDE